MNKVDPKFFEKLSEIYIATKTLNAREDNAIIEFAKFIDKTLNEEGNKGGKSKRL